MAKPGDKLPPGLMWRGKVIWVRVYAGGREKWASSHGTSIPAAQELRDSLKGQAVAGMLDKAIGRRGKAPTLGALITRYLPEWSGQASFRDVERHAKTWRESPLGPRRADDVTPGEIAKVLRNLAAEGEWKPASSNRCLAFLKTLLNKAVRDDVLEKNPCSKLKKLEEVPRDRHLSPAEAKKLQAVLSPEQWDIVSVAIWSGLRQAAQLGLKLTDVDLVEGTLKVQERAGRKKTPRLVPLVGDGLAAVQRLVERARAQGSPWLFPGRDPKRPLSAKGAHQMLARACQKAGIPDFHYHDLRHTCGSWLTQAGVPSLIVQEVLGHRTAGMTRRYVQTEVGHRREALSRIASYFPDHTVAKTVAASETSPENPDVVTFSAN